jgi:hypothetical protein
MIGEGRDAAAARSGPQRVESSMHLVFLTAWQDPRPDASVDLKRAATVLADELRGALDSATIAGTVTVNFVPRELTAWIYTTDAARAFATVAPILRGSSYCTAGCVLLRCGPAGTAVRQIQLSDGPGSTNTAMSERGPDIVHS